MLLIRLLASWNPGHPLLCDILMTYVALNLSLLLLALDMIQRGHMPLRR